jgi:hypothetical protein
MGLHHPFEHLKHKLWPKEGPGVKLASKPQTQPLKVRDRPDFLACKLRATYCSKALNNSYKFALDLISIGSLHTKLWASKVAGVLILGILGLPLGSPGTKCHLNVGPMAKHKVYYKGEGGGFP